MNLHIETLDTMEAPMTNDFWYGFFIGFVIVVLIVIVTRRLLTKKSP